MAEKKTGLKKTGRAPTTKQERAAKLMSENIRKPKPQPTGELLIEAGYSEAMSKTPSRITGSVTFQDLLDRYMPDDTLAKTHQRLLETRKIEHMTFPLGPANEDDIDLSGSQPNKESDIEKAGAEVERTTLTDEEIKTMLKDVNCTVRRIVHGNTARHVYYWVHDSAAQSKALELAYKMKGLVGKGEANTFVFTGNANFNSKDYIK